MLHPSFADGVVLLAHHHGQDHLAAQLDSIAHQQVVPTLVLIGNDGGPVPQQWPGLRLQLLEGPGIGAAANFVELARRAPPAAFYAFADQDDVWLPHKLARARDWLAGIDPTVPALYGSATLYIDAADRPSGRSRPLSRTSDFANALVQCGAGGNTMVCNRAALVLLLELAADHPEAAHDWLLHAAVLGCGGRFHYDPEPGVLYRQHAANLRGGNRGLRARALRLRGLFDGTFRERLDAHLRALHPLRMRLQPAARQQLDLFAAARAHPNPLQRLRLLGRSGVWRQSQAEQLALLLAAVLGRL